MHDWLQEFIRHYGVFGVFLGAGLEGETAVVVGGALAASGAFSPVAAAIAAFLGSTIADQALFALGRWRRNDRWITKLRRKRAFERALHFVERHPRVFCFVFRFLYGFRVAGPVAIGVSQVPQRVFVIANLASAAVWATVFTAIGYRFAPLLKHFISAILTIRPPILIALAVIVALILTGMWRARAE